MESAFEVAQHAPPAMTRHLVMKEVGLALTLGAGTAAALHWQRLISSLKIQSVPAARPA